MTRQKKFYLEPRKPTGIYYYVVRDPVSRKTAAYKSTGTTDERQAEAIAMEWWTNGIPGKTKGSGFDRKSVFCDYLFDFWDFETSGYFRELETMGKNPQPEHALEMQKIVDRYYRPYFGSLLLCEITEESLQKFVVYLKTKKNLASSTVNSARNASMKALRYALRKGYITHFDFGNVLRAGGKGKKRGTLEDEEVEQLLALEWRSYKSYIAVLINLRTGIRMSEIRGLRLRDIHEDYIGVYGSWGKRQKCTKNQEIREIPILPSVYSEIMAYINKMELTGPDSLLLPGRNPDKPYNNRQIGKDFNKMLEKIGIDDTIRRERNIVFHSGRHGMAKNLAENGIPKAIGMKILGQKTSRVYDEYADHADNETFRLMALAIKRVSPKASKKPPKEPIKFPEVV